MYSDLLSSITSIEDVGDALEAVDVIEERLYKTSSDYQQTKSSAAKFRFVSLINNEVDKQDNKSEWIKGLRSALKSAEVVRLEVGVEPTEEMVEKVISWVKDNISKSAVLDWDVDSRILAGAKVAFAGKFGDYSLATKLDEYWSKNGRD